VKVKKIFFRARKTSLYTSHSSPDCVSPIYQTKSPTYSTHVSPGVPYENASKAWQGST